MPTRIAPGGDKLSYWLVSVDGTGTERTDDPDGIDGLLTPRLLDELSSRPYTDVFVMSHGWMGDVPAAIDQYDRWIAAMGACRDDIDRARRARPGFMPLLIGFHWPSLPFGDESLDDGGGVSFSTPGVAVAALPDTEAMIDAYAERIADTPAARAALQAIFAAAAEDTAPPELPAEVVDAYRVLEAESGLSAGGPADGPGRDREAFDPEAAYQGELADSEVSFGSFGFGPVVGILRSLSYFKMKDRARHIGESFLHPLLARLQQAAAAPGRDVRFHLMGHSFGCIVISGALAGPPGGPSAAPVHSCLLAQGAVSFWSYCADIPHAPGQPGYFRRVVEGRRVTGALLTTQSEHDTAVGKAYPAASFVRGDVAFAPGSWPKYGALGAFGVRGPGVDAVDLALLPADQAYGFERGRIYNLESSHVIAEMQGLGTGAHNDIAHPEVAHAMWSAVLL